MPSTCHETSAIWGFVA